MSEASPRPGDGNGWARCRLGHRHWGVFGAAGLLLIDAGRVALQLRSVHTHEGGTWALPGGARDSHESVEDAALREAFEEAALDPRLVRPFATYLDDHGDWSYTTVLARPLALVELRPTNFESDRIGWFDVAEVAALPLHSGFAATWPALLARLDADDADA